MRKGDLHYYRNAGLTPPKPKEHPVRDILDNVIQPIRGMAADIKRGHLLHKQGYGGRRDSALKIAKEGKSAGRKRAPR